MRRTRSIRRSPVTPQKHASVLFCLLTIRRLIFLCVRGGQGSADIISSTLPQPAQNREGSSGRRVGGLPVGHRKCSRRSRHSGVMPRQRRYEIPLRTSHHEESYSIYLVYTPTSINLVLATRRTIRFARFPQKQCIF